MIYLISTVFIAELIILFSVVTFLIKADRQVCLLAEYTDRRRNILKWRMETLKDISFGLNEIMPNFMKKLREKQRKALIKQLNEIFQFVVLLFFKPKYKKMLLGTKTGIRAIKKLLKI